MKIAVATDDGVTICHHFGRAKSLVVVEVSDGEVVRQEIRNNFGSQGNKRGSCDHLMMINNLRDCEVVISNGMGKRIFMDLKENNVQPIVTDITAVDEAVKAYLKNELVNRIDKLH